MKRALTLVQRRGMNAVITIRQKPLPTTCAHCRNSCTVRDGIGYWIACKLFGVPWDAKTCPRFRDARLHLDGNFQRVA